MRHPVQLNPQLDPPQPLRRIRSGLGDAGIVDFNATLNDPSEAAFAAGWQDIQGQIAAEGGSLSAQAQSAAQSAISQAQGAVQSYYDAAGNVVSGVLQQGQSYYDQAGNLVQGGINQVTGLVQGAAQGTLNQVSQVVDTAGNIVSGAIPPQLQVVAGQISEQLHGSKVAYIQAYDQLSQGINSITSDPVAAAKEFVLAGNTIAGAIKTVGGMIQNFDYQKILPQSMAAFTGVMVSAAIGGGAVSAGIGAIIVGLIGALVSFMQGLYNTKLPPQDVVCNVNGSQVLIPQSVTYGIPDANAQIIVPDGAHEIHVPKDENFYGGKLKSKPTLNPGTVLPLAFTVGCMGVFTNTPQIAPGDAAWRTFPNFNDPDDANWFVPIYYTNEPGPGYWKNALFYTGRLDTSAAAGPNSPNTGRPVLQDRAENWLRPIDAAFPNYRYLECEMFDIIPGNEHRIPPISPMLTLKPSVTDFQKAFFAAWKSNQEYALNGFTPQSDGQVLLRLVRFWNASHRRGTIVLLQQRDYPNQPSYPIPCNSNVPKYFETILNQVPISAKDPYYSPPAVGSAPDGSKALFVYSGNMHSVPVTTNLQPLTNPNTPAVVTKRVAAASAASAAVAVLGAVVYSRVTGVALETVAKQVWGGVKGVFVKRLGRA
jgi:hypothetical protein